MARSTASGRTRRSAARRRTPTWSGRAGPSDHGADRPRRQPDWLRRGAGRASACVGAPLGAGSHPHMVGTRAAGRGSGARVSLDLRTRAQATAIPGRSDESDRRREDRGSRERSGRRRSDGARSGVQQDGFRPRDTRQCAGGIGRGATAAARRCLARIDDAAHGHPRVCANAGDAARHGR